MPELRCYAQLLQVGREPFQKPACAGMQSKPERVLLQDGAVVNETFKTVQRALNDDAVFYSAFSEQRVVPPATLRAQSVSWLSESLTGSAVCSGWFGDPAGSESKDRTGSSK